MAVSDADYELWLKADNKKRAMLIEAVAYSGGAAVTRYMSNLAFVSAPADTPASTAYEDIVKEVPQFSARIPETFNGESQMSWGTVVITNEGGVRDAWLSDAWDGRAVTIYFGDPAWAKSDFRTVLVGVADDIVAMDRDRIGLRIRDKSRALDVNLQTSLIGGTTANKDKPKPICCGQVFNIEPPLITAATHEYQVHDGAIEDVTDVRDNGVSVAYTKDLANGKFTLNATPAGRITCDAKGAKPGGVYHVKCADIVEYLITTRSSLTTSDRDATSFSDMNTACAQTLGFFAKESMSVMSALDEIVKSPGGFWTFGRDGKMRLGQFIAPTGTAAMELVADDVALNGLRMLNRITPMQTYRLGYARNYTPHQDALAGAVTEANRALYDAEYQVKTATNAGITTTYLLAGNPAEIGTLLADSTEAQTECTRRATLWGTLRKVFEVRCYAAPFALRLGQVIQLTHPRFGFAAGVKATVIGIRETATRKRVILELFV